MSFDGHKLNETLVRAIVKKWGKTYPFLWLVEATSLLVHGPYSEVSVGPSDGQLLVSGFGIFDGQVIGRDEWDNALLSGRISICERSEL